jgi:hypothetical protein
MCFFFLCFFFFLLPHMIESGKWKSMTGYHSVAGEALVWHGSTARKAEMQAGLCRVLKILQAAPVRNSSLFKISPVLWEL